MAQTRMPVAPKPMANAQTTAQQDLDSQRAEQAPLGQLGELLHQGRTQLLTGLGCHEVLAKAGGNGKGRVARARVEHLVELLLARGHEPLHCIRRDVAAGDHAASGALAAGNRQGQSTVGGRAFSGSRKVVNERLTCVDLLFGDLCAPVERKDAHRHVARLHLEHGHHEQRCEQQGRA